MFDDKGELSVPIVGFVLLGFTALFMGFAVLNGRWDLFDTTGMAVGGVLFVSGLLLLLTAYLSFKRAFIIEGMTFGMFGILYLVAGYGANMTTVIGIESLGFLGLVLCALALMIAFMAWRIGDVLIEVIAIFTILAFAPLGFAEVGVAVAASAIGFFFIALIAIYYALNDWMLVQDIAEDYAEFLYGDDCDCGCEGDNCGCGCEEHTEEVAEECVCGCEEHAEKAE
jgi:hypothetical protein